MTWDELFERAAAYEVDREGVLETVTALEMRDDEAG